MRAYESLDGRHPRAWVMTIARHKAIDHIRARARRPEPREELPEQVSAVGLPGERDGSGELWAQVAELPPKQRQAVALRFAADLAYADVAQALECSEEAARRSVHEGLKRLRESVAIAREAA
jgi:RNA polymerase sigma factor (sigma-70 family)